MSRYRTTRRRPTMDDFNASRAAWEHYEGNVVELRAQEHEREEDDLEARADARDARSSWTYRGDAA